MIELAGYEVVSCILSHLLKAINDPYAKEDGLIRQHINGKYTYDIFRSGTNYYKILAIIDIVSAMTDRYAVSLYKNLKGITLSSL